MPSAPVTVVDRINEQAKGENIHHFREGFSLRFHLVVDAVEVLFTPHHGGVKSLTAQRLAELAANLIDQLLAITAGRAPRRRKPSSAHRVEGFQPQILELHAHFVHSQPHGDGGVNIQGFAGDAFDFFSIENTQRAHVV